VGFTGNATAALHHGSDNPAAGEYRKPPEHPLPDDSLRGRLRYVTASDAEQAREQAQQVAMSEKPNGHDDGLAPLGAARVWADARPGTGPRNVSVECGGAKGYQRTARALIGLNGR
jgi:hypothetical protein